MLVFTMCFTAPVVVPCALIFEWLSLAWLLFGLLLFLWGGLLEGRDHERQDQAEDQENS